MKKKVALVVPTFSSGGGVPTVGKFIYDVLKSANICSPHIISLSGHYLDQNNISILRPLTWFSGVIINQEEHEGYSFSHFGAFLPEIPGQIFMPRKSLTTYLNNFDIVQIVAGSPAWGYIAKEVVKPVLLQVASLVKNEREKKLKERKGLEKLYQYYSIKIISNIEHKSLKLIKYAFVENMWMYKKLGKLIGDEKVVFAPPGVNTEFYYPASDNKNQEPYILTVSRLSDPRKNIRLLLQSYKLLKELKPTAPMLVLAGKSNLSSNDLQYATNNNIINYIEIRQNLSNYELARLYRNAMIFVLSSNEEGLGMVIIEAMASGLPVVSTDCGGPRTLITHGFNGFLTPVGDANSLCSKLDLLVSDGMKRIEMGINARKTILQHFSLKQAGKLFIDTYENLLKSI